jgi:hypothetical protein
MEDKKPTKIAVNAQEAQLIEQLRRQPKILDRVQKILQIAQAEGSLKTADEIEELLIQELRGLGNSTMNEWVAQAHEGVSKEVQSEHPRALKRKKKR